MTAPIETDETDTTTTTEAPGASAGGSETPPAEDQPKGNREAKYRVERNSARAERDALAARVEALQTRELERIAAGSLANPSDLLTLSGKSLQDFLDDDGELDHDLVAEAAAEILQSRPNIGHRVRATDPSQGLGGRGKSAPSWEGFLRTG